MAAATPALACLEALGIAHAVHGYTHDPRSTAFGDEAVAALGVDPDRFFKTLVVEVERTAPAPGRRPVLACGVVPVSGTLDLRAFAARTGSKRAAMAPLPAVERSTGYIRGAISPIGQKTSLETLVDESAVLFDTVFVSAGQRGLALELAPDDLLRAAAARYAQIADPG